MKLAYSSIQFELTRRCNQSCIHCCRGESQNLDLTKQVVDAFFDKNDIYSICDLKFSGGEPTLNGEMLEYIVDKIIEKDIIVYWFTLSINGLSYNESFKRGLIKLNEYCKRFDAKKRDAYGMLMVSQTQYHQFAKKDILKKFKDLPFFINPIGVTNINDENLLPYGNAVKNNLTYKLPDLAEVVNYEDTFSVKEYEGEEFLVFKCQYISSNGNVLIDGCISYDMMDEYNIGNVLDETIEKMYLRKSKKFEYKVI